MGGFIVVRIRGRVDVRKDIKETLKRLNLHKKFHATIVPDDPSYRGMLFKVKDYVAYGPADPEIVKKLLLHRGRLVGNEPLTEEYVKEKLKMSIDELAEKLARGEMKLKQVRGLKPVFRLHPPRGGFKKSTKKHVTAGGELGYREDIAKLVERML
jgi:large subunit ribosomal protein L30